MNVLEAYHTEIRYVFTGLIAVYLVWAGDLNAETALAICAGVAFPTLHFIGGKNNAKGSSK